MKREHSLVYNIEPATPSMLRSLDWHCAHRSPDGSSAIDLTRSHLNRRLVGHEDGIYASLEDLYASGVHRPTRQAEAPYLRIVVSASPSFFRPTDPGAKGTWQEDRLEVWLSATLQHLAIEHGRDLVHAELHLDEDTPHIHAVVAPTYGKKARKPGRKKRDESDKDFEARKAAAAASEAVMTVGRASHPELSRPGSFRQLRTRMATALDHLGIGYGEDRSVEAPEGKSTRQWVIDQAVAVRRQQHEVMAERDALQLDRAKFDQASAELKVQADRIDQARILLRQERDDLQKARKTLEQREQGLDSIIARLGRVVRQIGDRLGVSLARSLSGAIRDLEDEASRSRVNVSAALPATEQELTDGPGL